MSQKKFRDEEGLFIVEGEKLVEEALCSDFEVVKVYRRDEIGEAAMARISQLRNPSPALAVVRIPTESQAAQAPSDSDSAAGDKSRLQGLVLGLDSLRDPGNLGTIIRVADWFGIKDVFATFDTVDVYNPKVVQATMGAIFRVRMHYCDLKATAGQILSAGGKVYGTFLDGKDIYTCPLESGDKAPVMIVIGNEADGISDRMAQTVSERLYIPPFPDGRRDPEAAHRTGEGTESLNAAIATAITVAEFRRRQK